MSRHLTVTESEKSTPRYRVRGHTFSAKMEIFRPDAYPHTPMANLDRLFEEDQLSLKINSEAYIMDRAEILPPCFRFPSIAEGTLEWKSQSTSGLDLVCVIIRTGEYIARIRDNESCGPREVARIVINTLSKALMDEVIVSGLAMPAYVRDKQHKILA